MTEPLLTARQLADVLGVSTDTLLRWTRAGEVPAIKLPGGAVRYRPDAIEEWLDGRTTSRAGAAVEESPDTPGHARRGGGYPGALVCELPDTRPPREAATNEEDDHAG